MRSRTCWSERVVSPANVMRGGSKVSRASLGSAPHEIHCWLSEIVSLKDVWGLHHFGKLSRIKPVYEKRWILHCALTLCYLNTTTLYCQHTLVKEVSYFPILWQESFVVTIVEAIESNQCWRQWHSPTWLDDSRDCDESLLWRDSAPMIPRNDWRPADDGSINSWDFQLRTSGSLIYARWWQDGLVAKACGSVPVALGPAILWGIRWPWRLTWRDISTGESRTVLLWTFALL